MPPHLLADVSHHGYGHFAQAAPVLSALKALCPELRVTLRCALPHALVARRLRFDFDHLPVPRDTGMRMASSIDVLARESHAGFAALHADWDARIERESREIRRLAPDLVLANVSYLSIAAARHAGVRPVALCSLNWADIYAGYCLRMPGGERIHAQMQDAYRAAECFIRPAPSMPMDWLPRRRETGPIARTGADVRAAIDARLGLRPGTRLVLVNFGGIPGDMPPGDWPRAADMHWIMPDDWPADRADMTPYRTLGMDFTDVLASCDALLTKPGYGAITEAVCNRVPVVYVRRGDWPEEPGLLAWLHAHGVAREIGRETFRAAAFLEQVLDVIGPWDRPPVAADGAREAAGIMLSLVR